VEVDESGATSITEEELLLVVGILLDVLDEELGAVGAGSWLLGGPAEGACTVGGVVTGIEGGLAGDDVSVYVIVAVAVAGVPSTKDVVSTVLAVCGTSLPSNDSHIDTKKPLSSCGAEGAAGLVVVVSTSDGDGSSIGGVVLGAVSATELLVYGACRLMCFG